MDNQLQNLLVADGGERFPVSGRELHERLEIKTPYTMWFSRMAEYGFEEGKDFLPKPRKSTGGRPAIDHLISTDMARQLSMIQRTPIGMQVRQYLIELESHWNSPECVVARGLKMSDRILADARNYYTTPCIEAAAG